jgi:hypothetical protein
MVALSNAPFNGARDPRRQASRYFWPHHLTPDKNTALATTGARYYVAPFFVSAPTTFAGAWCYNSGAGDNGDKIKIAAYNESGSGGPGTLAKDFGEVTLTGASAVRNFASSWTAPSGWYYLELVSDNAVSLYTMAAGVSVSGVGLFPLNHLANQLGVSVPTVSTAPEYEIPAGEYVGGTYANFPEATSLTPATTLFSTGGSFPWFGLYT